MFTDRRRFLRVGGLALAGLSGCLGAGGIDDPVTVQATRIVKGDDGSLVGAVTVSNVAESEVTTTLYVTANLADGPIVRKRQITLDAHQTHQFEVAFDVAYDSAIKNGKVSMSADVKRDD